MAIATINPATGEKLNTFEALTEAEIEEKLALGESAFEKYRHTKMAQRSEWLNEAANILEKDALRFGKIMTTEMGKPIQSAIAEAKKCITGTSADS